MNDIFIEVIEPSGIKSKLGHLQQGERRLLPRAVGTAYVLNGWATHIVRDGEEQIATGERGSKDRKSVTQVASSAIK